MEIKTENDLRLAYKCDTGLYANVGFTTSFELPEEVFEFWNADVEDRFDAAFEGDPNVSNINDLLKHEAGDNIEVDLDLELEQIPYIIWLEEKLINANNLNTIL